MENKYRSLDDLPVTLRVEELMPILGIGRNTAYELVRSGEWTHAKFMECIANAYEDTNGDGKRDATDFYGMGTNNASAVLKFMFHSSCCF